MERMDRYNNEENLSRSNKNEDLYKDLYKNDSVGGISDLFDEDTTVEINIIQEPMKVIEQQEYDINSYLDRARQEKMDDNIRRSLDNTNCDVNIVNANEDEISKLIQSLEEKEKADDLFASLLPEDSLEDTVIEGQEPSTELDALVDEEDIYQYEMAAKGSDEENEDCDTDFDGVTTGGVDTETIKEKLDENLDEVIELKEKVSIGNVVALITCIILFLILVFIILKFIVGIDLF